MAVAAQATPLFEPANGWPDHPCRRDPQSRLLEACVDLADGILRDRVGLDDRKGAFNRHVRKLRRKIEQIQDFTIGAPARRTRFPDAVREAPARRSRRPVAIAAPARSPHRHGHRTSTVAGRRPSVQSMPRAFGSQIDIAGQYVTTTRKTSIVNSHGHTAIVSSVMPMRVIPEAT